MFYKVLILFLHFLVSKAQYEGEGCIKDGMYGVCRNLRRCQTAIEDRKRGINPQICSFYKRDPIVCCLDDQTPPVATTTRRPSTTSTTEYIPPVYDYVNLGPTGGQCEPIADSLTIKKTGQKALDKCIEYQEKYVYPCGKGVALTGELSRSNKCHHNADELILGGTDAAPFEFPHMALMGFGERNSIEWECGGSIISERFILTAGHCTFRRSDPLTYAAIGILRRMDTADPSKIYKIKNIIKHPEYMSPIIYHDIALIETEKVMQLNQYTVPACLHTGDIVNDDRVIATGWGNIRSSETHLSDVLQKVILSKIEDEECRITYRADRNRRRGFDNLIQSCYGDLDTIRIKEHLDRKDTCRGDSGGPIQIKNRKIHCMYTVVGVTSVGKHNCGGARPAVYTRVAKYLSWIESIVWP